MSIETFGFFSISRGITPDFGCERASARSHPKSGHIHGDSQ
jgi:hypothetical protein